MVGRKIAWPDVMPLAEGLSQAELARVADEAMKEAILGGKKVVGTADLLAALNARRTMREAVADIFSE